MSMSLPLIFLQLLLAIVVAASQALPGCENLCGNISVPYPFGTRPGCFKSDYFLVTCNSSFNPPKLYLTRSLIEVTDIFLSFGYAVIKGSQGRKYTTGCLSLCDSIDNVINGSCSGIGCCQTIIPKEVRSYNIRVNSYDNHSSVWDFNPCSYSFVAEDNTYTFSSLDLADLQGRTSVPVVLDWAVGNETCAAARKNQTSFACKQNSKCYNFDNGPGYRCNCSDGYEGNPYLSNGCQDIDECKISSPCNMTCHNLPGTYVIKDGKAEKLKEFAIVAKGCLEVKGDERPTMKEVAMELQGLRTVVKASMGE
ncbi:hypothetical protein Acr_21g0004660 [Actinidia rufa]|uniref:EGF-like domain-containing protein n=1 Tax=Actinidia rufa TaxID=165716 RepID=A0A7J0GGB9_9ERIC|nr:hypothetical protein Acr_21g0004660 [Actinidia rufa]